MHTNLAASVDVEQTNPTSQVLCILDTRPQNTGGEIQGAFIRLDTQKHTDVLLPAAGQNVVISILIITAERPSRLIVNISEHQLFFFNKDLARHWLLRLKTNNSRVYIFLLYKERNLHPCFN